MSFCCLKYRKTKENINPKVLNTSNGKTMLLSKCVKFGSKRSRFIKRQEGKGILISLGLKKLLSKVSLLCDIFFWMQL